MISPYLILAYLQKGDFSGARIERNRTLTKISQYIEEKPEERAYLENPFARYLTAIMYEMENKNDDAKIEYRKMQWDAEVKRLESKIEKTTDLLILVDVGTAPQKQEMKWGPQPINAGGSTITLGFAYAAYSPTTTKATNCNIYLNEQPVGTANILYNLEDTVITQYEKNKPALLSKLSARMAAKALTQLAAQKGADTVAESSPWTGFLLKAAATIAGVAWVNAEQADLRSWLTLPKQINYLRLNDLAPGEHAVTIDYGCGRQTKTVKLEKDKINIAYFVFVQ
jgi:hypothetical protein